MHCAVQEIHYKSYSLVSFCLQLCCTPNRLVMEDIDLGFLLFICSLLLVLLSICICFCSFDQKTTTTVTGRVVVTGPIEATRGTAAATLSRAVTPRPTDGHVSVTGPMAASNGTVADTVSRAVKPRATDGHASATGTVAATHGTAAASRGCFWWQCSCAGRGGGCSGGIGGCGC